MGAQFIHQNTYGLVLTANSKKENSSTVSSILAEATRQAGNCPHVENPQKPITLFGNIDEIIPACEDWLDKTRDPLGKKTRKDASCLIAGVFSCSPEDNHKWQEIRDESIKYLKNKFGDILKCVIEHEDEPFQSGLFAGEDHKHAHYYVVPFPGEALENIHEGKKAVAEVKKSWNAELKTYAENPEKMPDKLKEKVNIKAESKDLLKQLKKVSNASAEMYAYKTAMRQFQDDYFISVSARMGLTRTGPKRMRLTRAENNARKREAEEIAGLLNLAKKEAYESGRKSVEDIETRNKYYKQVFPMLKKTILDSFNAILQLIEALEKKELTEEEFNLIENVSKMLPQKISKKKKLD